MKSYTTPCLHVVQLHTEAALLCGSAETCSEPDAKNMESPVGSTQYTSSYESNDIWD